MKLIRKPFNIEPLNTLRRVIPLLSLMVMVVALGSPTVYADAKSDAAKQAYLKSLQETRSHLNEVEQKLSEIQKDTIASYPDLQKQEQQFRALLMSTMSSKDYDANQEMKRLTELQEELQKKDLKQQDKRKLFREFIQRKSHFEQAQNKAFSEPKIKKAQTDLQDAMVDAMKKKHPETGALMQDLENTQKKFAKQQASAP